ncbi:hypothetical protein ABIB85_004386 [Bradyrhizobium sp. JR1.5]
MSGSSPKQPLGRQRPSHRVYVGRVIGAAWSKRSNEGRDYLGLKLDDPSCTAPIFANLFVDEEGDGFSLIGSRPAVATATDPIHNASPGWSGRGMTLLRSRARYIAWCRRNFSRRRGRFCAPHPGNPERRRTGGRSDQTGGRTAQGGPLSPVLGNFVLDDLDKELTRRGHRFSLLCRELQHLCSQSSQRQWQNRHKRFMELRRLGIAKFPHRLPPVRRRGSGECPGTGGPARPAQPLL